MFKVTQKGDFRKTFKFLKTDRKSKIIRILNKYGSRGVSALSSSTPSDTGKTASSWSYEIDVKDDSFSLYFKNSNIVNGVPIAIVIQYGHATKNGGYVKGIDYINPALKPIMNEIAEKVWKEVSDD